MATKVFALIALASMLGACATREVPAYSGQRRPRDQIAVIAGHMRKPFAFSESMNILIVKVDGIPLEPPRYGQDVEILPGAHFIEVSGSGGDFYSVENQLVLIDAAPGARYEIRSSQERDDGIFSITGRWKASVVEIKTP